MYARDNRKIWTAVSGLVCLIVAGLACAAPAETILLVMPHRGIEVADSAVPSAWAKAGSAEKLVAGGITFNITYLDGANIGFNNPADGPERKARLEDALSYIAEAIGVTGTLDVEVRASEFDGTGALAYAGTYYPGSQGFNDGTSFMRLDSGTKPYAGYPEIVLTVDFGFDWNTTLGAPGPTEADMLSVLVHEFTHGLSYATLANPDGSSQISPGVYTTFDSFLLSRTDAAALFGGSPPHLQLPGDRLASNDLAFSGTAADSLYNQADLPGIYAPNPFEVGSSLQHWDTGNIVGGAVMEHFFVQGMAKRRYAPVDVGALIDLGYADAAQPAEGEGESEGAGPVACDLAGVNVTSPTGNIIIPQGQGTANVFLTTAVTFDTAGGCVQDTVEVNYELDGTGVGSSQDAAGGFLVSLSLPLGDYVLSATATVLSTGFTMADMTGFSVQEQEPAIAVTPNPAGGYDFGNINAGETAEAAFTVSNAGDGTLSGQASVTGSGFSLLGMATYVLGAADTAVVRVLFAPTQAGAYNGTLSFAPTKALSLTITLRGTGIEEDPQIAVVPGPPDDFSFGEVETGSSTEAVFNVTNTGGGTLDGALTIAGDTVFSVIGDAAYQLAADATTPLRVQFAPAAAGEFAATLTFSGGANGPVTLTVRGTGVEPGRDCACTKEGKGGPDPAQAFLAGTAILALFAMGGRAKRRD